MGRFATEVQENADLLSTDGTTRMVISSSTYASSPRVVLFNLSLIRLDQAVPSNGNQVMPVMWSI